MKPAPSAHLLRELGRSPLSGAVVAVTLPVWFQLARSDDDVHTAATFMVISGASLLALAFDDRTEHVLGACAVTRNSRRALRGLIVASIVVAGWCAALLVADARGADIGSLDDRLPETVAAAALASAGAAVATRRGVRAPGLAAASTTLLAMVTATGIAGWSTDFDWLPQIANPSHASRWWLTATIAGLAGCWWSRDPAARSFVAGIRRPPSEPSRPRAATDSLKGRRRERRGGTVGNGADASPDRRTGSSVN